MLRHGVLRGKANEAARVVHLVHHAVARVHAQAAANALVLQAVANVDAGGAHLHAQRAVNAVAQAGSLGVHLLAACAARLAARAVVGDDERVFIEHGALKACVGAHVLAHLLAHMAGKAVGGEGVKEHPEDLPGALQRQNLAAQRADGHKKAHEGKARPQRHGHPGQLLGALAPDFFPGTPGRFVQAHARAALAFNAVFQPHEDFCIDGLRAGKAAPQPPSHGGEQKQRQRRDDEQPRQVDEVLRVQHQAKEVKAPRLQVKQHHLALAPLQPGQAVEHQLGDPHHDPAPAVEHAIDGARVHLAFSLVQGNEFAAGGGGVLGWFCHGVGKKKIDKALQQG